ncbi:MAG: glycosyltransferase [Candidatus Shapirobacteria bacterium]|nr:glycosyltransferase [Candidatus Shapirobacteria bacterium]
MIKRAALYTPYAKTLGGGERYLLTLAQVLLDSGWQVETTFENKKLLDQARQRFNLSLEGLDLLSKNKFYKGKISNFLRYRGYDLLFWVSDGSIPTMLAKKNWLHFQVPFHDLSGRSLFNIMKLRLVDKVICNSHFTKKIIDLEYGVDSFVWYPPVSTEDFYFGKKENVILAVGRFEATMSVKRQDVLVSVFKKLVDEGLKGWKLILIGGSLAQEKENRFLNKLKEESENYPVEFRVNAPFGELKKAYSRAKVFWHAAGYGVDEQKEPEKVEHFGMTTIEAMASGCWPLVYAAGGQKEIFENFYQKDLCLWVSKEELLQKTKTIIKSLPNQEKLIDLAQKFSVINFNKNVQKAL